MPKINKGKLAADAIKVFVAFGKHAAGIVIGDETLESAVDVVIDILGEDLREKAKIWLNKPELKEKIALVLRETETCMRKSSGLPAYVRTKLHDAGQRGGFFFSKEYVIEAMFKPSSTSDEEQLIKVIQSALKAEDDEQKLNQHQLEKTSKIFIKCLRKAIVSHMKGDWQEDIINQTILKIDDTTTNTNEVVTGMAKVTLPGIQKSIDQLTVNQSTPEKKIPQMPAAWRDFTGREKELDHLRERRQTEQIIIIHGAPGVGKTALALDYAHQIKDDYPDGQIYLNLRGVGDTKSVPGTPSYDPAPLTTAQILTHILFELGISTEGITNHEDKLLARYRQELNGKKLLILLDNASNGAQIEKAVQITPHNFFLVTSRQEDFLNYPLPIHLREMLPEDAVRFLQKLCPSRFKAAEALTLAKKLGNLPLALRLAGNTLNQKQYLSVEEYLNRLQNQNEKLSLIEAAVEVSLVELPSTPIDYAQQWIELAVVSGTFSAYTVENICPLQRYTEEEEIFLTYEDSLNTLKNYGLLEWDPFIKRYDYHDTLRDYARSLWGEEQEKELRIQHATVFKELLAGANRLFISSDGDEDQRYQQRQQALSTYARIEGEIIQARDWLVECVNQAEKDTAVLTLCSQLSDAGVYILDIRMPTRERIQWLKAAALACQQTGDKRGEGNRLGNLGLVYYSLGEIHKAIEYFQQVLVNSKEIGNRRAEGSTLGNLGLAYRNLGEVQKAIEYHQQALAISREIGDRRGEELTLGNLGLAYRNLGEIQKAIEYYQQALTIAREIGDRLGEGNHLGNLGSAYYSLGEVQKAIEYYQQALTIAREIGDRRGEGSDLGNLGSAYFSLGEIHKAFEYNQQALVIYKEIGDRQGEGIQLGNLGNAYANLGEVNKAIEYHRQGLAIAQEIGDKRGEGSVLGNLGNAYAALGEIHKAIEYHQEALVISKEIGDRQGEEADLSSLGLAYADLGEVQKAIEYHQQALAISREIGDKRGEGIHLGNLGNAYFVLGEVQKAIEYHQEALVIAQEIGDKRGEGNHLGNLGNAYADLGEVQKAIEYYQRALAISKEIGDRQGEGIHLGNLGSAYATLGDMHMAIENYEQALAIAKEIGNKNSEVQILNNLKKIKQNIDDLNPGSIVAIELRYEGYKKTQSYDSENNENQPAEEENPIEQIKQALQSARETGNRRNQVIQLINLGEAYCELNEHQEAAVYFQKALKIASGLKDKNRQGTILDNLGNAYTALGETSKAIEYYQQALTIAKENRNKHSEAQNSFNLALAIYQTDKLQAHKLLCQAYRIWTQMGVPDREDALALMQKWGISPEDCN